MYELVTFQRINVCDAICYLVLWLAIDFKTGKCRAAGLTANYLQVSSHRYIPLLCVYRDYVYATKVGKVVPVLVKGYRRVDV
jgi:hypothetical protein